MLTGFRSAYSYSETGYATIDESIKATGRDVKENPKSITSIEKNHVNASYTRELGDVSFKIKKYEDLDPYSISYEDYKNLNYDALETIFGKYTKEWDDAVGLLVQTSLTEDETLNKIYFDKMKETNGKDNTWFYTIGIMATYGEMNTEGNYLLDKDTFFKGFELVKNDFSNPDSPCNWQIDTNAVIKVMDEIKAEYEKRVAENEALLKELTKNNKPNPLDAIESSDG